MPILAFLSIRTVSESLTTEISRQRTSLVTALCMPAHSDGLLPACRVVCVQGPDPCLTAHFPRPLWQPLGFVWVLKRRLSRWDHTCEDLVRGNACVAGNRQNEKRLEEPLNWEASEVGGWVEACSPRWPYCLREIGQSRVSLSVSCLCQSVTSFCSLAAK